MVVERGTLVTFDLGVRLDGYCSDCTRTWATGDLPASLAEAYELVLRAQLAALDAVRPGPEGREIDAIARDLIADAGHGDHFGHGLGHGVGRDVHEAPRLARTGGDPLAAGKVVTVEPGVYLPGCGRRPHRGSRGRDGRGTRCPHADHERACSGRLRAD